MQYRMILTKRLIMKLLKGAMRKTTIFILGLLISLQFTFPLHASTQNTSNTHEFYKNYTVNIPDDNYIIISMRSFAPNKYLLLDININEIRIYSPYENVGLLSKRNLTKKEIAEILEIFTTKEYIEVPLRNNTSGMCLKKSIGTGKKPPRNSAYIAIHYC